MAYDSLGQQALKEFPNESPCESKSEHQTPTSYAFIFSLLAVNSGLNKVLKHFAHVVTG